MKRMRSVPYSVHEAKNTYAGILVLVDLGDGRLERLHRQSADILLLLDFEPTLDEHLLVLDVVEAQLDLRLDFRRSGDLREGL